MLAASCPWGRSRRPVRSPLLPPPYTNMHVSTRSERTDDLLVALRRANFSSVVTGPATLTFLQLSLELSPQRINTVEAQSRIHWVRDNTNGKRGPYGIDLEGQDLMPISFAHRYGYGRQIWRQREAREADRMKSGYDEVIHWCASPKACLAGVALASHAPGIKADMLLENYSTRQSLRSVLCFGLALRSVERTGRMLPTGSPFHFLGGRQFYGSIQEYESRMAFT